MKKIITPAFLFISVAVLAAAASRLLPHPYNFAPVGAMALFAGARMNNKFLAFLVPFAAMLFSDLLLEFRDGTGFHDTMWAVYGSFGLTVFLGYSLKNKKGLGPVFGMSLLSSGIFFLVTNFAVWMSGGLYPMDLSGLIMCYEAAVPFYRNDFFPMSSPLFNTILGDLIYNGILFGAFSFASVKFPALAKA